MNGGVTHGMVFLEGMVKATRMKSLLVEAAVNDDGNEVRVEGLAMMMGMGSLRWRE